MTLKDLLENPEHGAMESNANQFVCNCSTTPLLGLSESVRVWWKANHRPRLIKNFASNRLSYKFRLKKNLLRTTEKVSHPQDAFS